ncbi:hypothetical protein JCM3765_004563 [Sporobolomyces pararoseus]
MTGDTSESSNSDQLASNRTKSETIPAASRGRPRSTSISSGSPNPAPGVPLPTLFPDVAPAPPQLSHSSNTNLFPFSFPSNSSSVTGTASTSLASNLGQHQFGKSTSNNGGGGGHKSSLSVPGIVSPSPLAPGAVPRGGRHRRTQSVSPPGFSTMSQHGENGFSTVEQVEARRSSEPSIAVLKAEGSPLGISTTSSSPRQPRLNISTSIGTRLGHQRSPSSPTRSPRAKALFSTSPTNPPAFEQHQSHPSSQPQTHVHHTHHPHVHSSQHHPPISSHAALLQGVRSHALPHSPTLDACTSHHHDVSPLSTSPSMPHHSSFSARRLSGGQHSSARPFVSTSLSASTSLASPSSPSATLSSPPFGPTSSSPNGRLSPIPLNLSRQVALDHEMTDEISDTFTVSPPTRNHGFHSRRRSSGSSYSPPLLPLPFDVHSPTSPSAPVRSRSNSIGRSVSSSTSPASLFLEEDQKASSPNGLVGGSSPRSICHDEVDITRPLSPSHDTDSLFPTSGPLPAPSPPVSLSSLGFDIPSPIVASPPRESSSSTSSTFNVTPLSPAFSALSASRPPLAASPLLSPSPISPTIADASDSLPPASPHQKPISLPPPLNAPTPLPPHLVGGSAARSRSRSRSREREKTRSQEKSSSRSRSRSGSREREDMSMEESEKPRSPLSPIASGPLGSAGMRLTGLEFAPKVHSPLASPPATEPEESSKMSESEETEDMSSRQGEERETAVEASSQDATAATAEEGEVLPPSSPAPSNDPQVSSALGLPHLSIPVATSPVGDPEHLEESPTSHSSYFALAPGAALARSPPPLPDHLATLPSIPIHQHTSSWEDEFDEDDFDDLDHDGSGELGVSNAGRRKSSGTRAEEERVSILQALGISKSQAERDEERDLSERAAERRRIELETRENERLELLRKEEEERALSKEYGSMGFMDIDLEAQGAEDDGEKEDDQGFGEAGDLSVGDLGDERFTIDEESLSALEKIFVCAKSEAVEERARVAHSLADWLPAVEICEAVEYVLPLLAGLIEDEMVKEVFAPQLDRVMWHFFSHCPLTEVDARFDKESSTIDVAVPSRFQPRSESLVESSPVPSPGGPSDRSTTPPTTSQTSPAQSETSSSNLPRISATTFTALLGALLTDQSTTVAKAAEAAIVRFLCRLKSKAIPSNSEFSEFPSSDLHPFQSSEVTTVPALAVSEPDPHSTYDFSYEARQILEDEIVSGIVIGLARLDEEDPERSTTIDHAPEVHKTQVDQIKEEDEKENPVLFSSPEENTIDFDEGDSDFDMKMLMEWTQSREREARGDSNIDLPPSSSPQDQIFSSFSPDQPADEESSIGKMVSMSLIGAIAAADCLESSVISKQFLPEVEKMKSESMFYVRKEAVQALGHLASAVSSEDLEQTLLPLHTFFSRDQLWHVRRAAVLALPSVCKRLPRPALHEKAVEAIRLFSADDNRNVRSGALEIAGELIYLFHQDPEGVPEELLAFFLGKPLDSNGDTSTSGQDLSAFSNQISHFKSALDSPSSSFLDASNSWQSPGFFSRNTRDADRSILTAFNFPAVVLTLGGGKWNLVCDQHQALCKDPVEKARQSLASSLHEVAKIIGPDQTDTSLFAPLADFLQDAENVQSAVLENIPTLFMSFGSETGRKAVRLLGDAWSDIGNWRLREHALKKVAEFGPHFMQNDGEEEVLSILAKAFKDSVASVREQAVIAIPPLLNSVLDQPSARAKLFAFLNVFRTDSSYRNRVAYVSTIVACVRASLPRATFELHFLDTLVELARDRVVSVRIAVARAISESCQNSALYSGPSTRLPLREILSILAISPDRDVRLPVLDYYVASPSPTSESSPLSPLKTRQNRTSFGVNVEDSPKVSAQAPNDEDSDMNEEEEKEEGRRRDDVDMEESPSSSPFESDGVLLELERPSPSTSSGEVFTRDEDDFVEVTRT